MPLFKDIFNRLTNNKATQTGVGLFNNIFSTKFSIGKSASKGIFAPKVEQTANTITTTEYKPVSTTNNIITKKLVVRKFNKNDVMISETKHNIGDTIDLPFKKAQTIPPPPPPVRKYINFTFKSTLDTNLLPNGVVNILSQDIDGNKTSVNLVQEKTVEISSFEAFKDIKFDVSGLGNYIVKSIYYKKVNKDDLENRQATDFNSIQQSYLELKSNELISDYIITFDIIYNPDLYPAVSLVSPTQLVEVDETYLRANQGEDFSINFYTKFAESYKITTPTGTKEYLVSEFTTDYKSQLVQLNSLEHFGNKFGNVNVVITPYSTITGDGKSQTLVLTIGKEYEYPRLKSITYEDYIYIPSFSDREITTTIDYEYVLTDNVYFYIGTEDDNGLVYKGGAKGSVKLNYKELLLNGKLKFNSPGKAEVIVVPYNVRGDRTIKGDREIFTITFDEADYNISTQSIKEDLFESLYQTITKDLSYSDDPRYLNHIVEVGDDTQILIANWDVDPTKFTNFKIDELGNTIPDGDINNTIVLRLYEPLPGNIEVHTPVWVSKLMSLPIVSEVKVSGFAGLKCPELKGPNFNASVDFVKSNSLDYASYDEIILSGSTTSQQLVETYLSKNDISTQNINVDYKSSSVYLFDNFVKYSSAKERVINFRYKQELYEYYSHSVTLLTGSSTAIQLEKQNVEKKKNNLKAGFDGFETFLVSDLLESGSTSGKFINAFDSELNISAYELVSTNWYDNLVLSASLYDKDNRNSLRNNLPDYIQNNGEYEEFLLFCDMIGQHFDIIHSYVKNMTEIRNVTENSLDGIHDDYLYVYLKQFGWDAKNLSNSADLWKYFLGVDADGNSPTRQLDNGQSLTDGNGFLNGEKATKRVWRRIANNLPYLLKHKGTSRGVKALLSCYGVPESQLSIVEFGGPNDNSTETTKFTYENTTAALIVSSSTQLTMSWDSSTRAIETRFKLEEKDHNEYTLITANDFVVKVFNSSSVSSTSTQYEKYGCLTFTGSGASITSSQYPLYDGKWHSLLVQNDNGNVTLTIKQADNEFIIQSASANVTFDTASWELGNTLRIGGFNGEIDEIRLWNTPLSSSVFDSHVIGPEMINGNEYNSSTENLLIRLDFERPQSINSNRYVNNIAPNKHGVINAFVSGAIGLNSTYPYNYNVYNRKVVIEIPNSGASRFVNNKVRFEEQTLINDLSPKKRATAKQYDQAVADSNKLGIFFSPNKDLDLNIAQSFGGISFDNYIGDPADDNSYEYKTLKNIRNYWFERIDLNRRNIYDYIKLVRSYDKSLFENIKEMLPARTSTNIGLLIAPHMLERSKVDINTKPEISNYYHSASYDYTNDYSITSQADIYKETNISADVLTPSFSSTNIGNSASIDLSTNKTLEATISSLDGTILETKKDGPLDASNEYYATTIDAGLRIPSIVSTIGMDDQKIVGINNFTDYGFSNYFTNGYIDYKYMQNGKQKHKTLKGSLVTTSKRTFTGQYTGSEGKTTYKYGGATPIFISSSTTELVLQDTGSNAILVGSEFNKEIVTKVKTINGYLPTHYKNVGDLTTGLKNSYYKGSKQNSNTTIDGKAAVEIFISNPSVLRVNNQGRPSGEPILEVD